MSIKAVTWAFEQTVKDSVAKLILIGLADRFNPDLGYAYPSVAWLAQVADCSTRTVQRKLDFLEETGFVRTLSTSQHDARTHGKNKYLLPAMTGGDSLTGGDKNGGTGDTDMSGGRVTTMCHPNDNKTMNYNILINSFDLFWDASPKKVGKQAAFKAWKRAVKTTSPDTLIDAIKAYAEICQRKGTEKAYIKHPATWLNGGCWDDEHDEPEQSSDNFGISQRWMPRDRDEFWSRFEAMPEYYRSNRPDIISLAKQKGWLNE